MQKPSGDVLNSLRSNLNVLVPLTDQAWEAAGEKLTLRRYDAGEHLFSTGEMVTKIFFLTAGLVRFYYVDAKGREFNKSFAGSGQVLSSVSSLATEEPSPFAVQALAPTQAFTLHRREFLTLAERFQEWAALRVIVLEQVIIKRERREADLLLLSATERYQKFLEDYPDLIGAIPNYHIASYLGITEVALSRIRRQLGLTQVNASPSR